ncbi:MAG: hypothetical protein ABUS57_09285, partial [Pseudomonadota bacterium]
MNLDHTRRDALMLSLAALALSATPTQAGEAAMTDDIARHAHDWDWLEGAWNVRHHRLKERLAGCTEWDDFAGTCRM